MPIYSGGPFSGGAIAGPLRISNNTAHPVLRVAGGGAAGDYNEVAEFFNASGDEIARFDSAGELDLWGRDSDAYILSIHADSLTTGYIFRASLAAGLTPLWWLTHAGYEAAAALAEPADGVIAASQVVNWYDATNGAAKFGRKGKTADGTVVKSVAPMAPAITSGALPTVALVSGAASQVALNRDAATVTPFTGDATNNAATCKVELSPDNVTFSTLNTVSIAAALNLTGAIDLNIDVRVPAAWYLKLTATHGTLGTTTYY